MVLVRPQFPASRPRARARLAAIIALAGAWLTGAGQTTDGEMAGEAAARPAAAPARDAAPASPAAAAGSDTQADSPEPVGAGLPTEEYLTRLETQIRFVDLVQEQRFEEALPLAQRMVELTEEEFGSPSSELATSLNNLAIVQRNLEQYDASKDTFVRAIDMYREVEGQFTESVINPLMSLGANYHATGDYAQALGLFEEARTVNRRSFGLLNPDQIDIVEHITATLASMHRYEEAQRQQQDALRLMERVHGTDTMEILPYLYKYADWLVDTFQFEAGRQQYVRAMDIIREHEGPDGPAMIEPLRRIGNSYRAQKLAEGRGIGALRQALEIAESQPEPDKLVLARVLRDIGDWYTAFSRAGSTGDEYRRAWDLLGEAEEGERRRRRWFGEPDYVLREYPSSRGLAEPGEPGAVEGYVRVVFDVDENGEPLNVRLLESDPPEFKDETMLRAIRRSRFRPRVVDGEPTYTTGLIRNFSFYYEPEE